MFLGLFGSFTEGHLSILLLVSEYEWTQMSSELMFTSEAKARVGSFGVTWISVLRSLGSWYIKGTC